jgi:hypothetical protein
VTTTSAGPAAPAGDTAVHDVSVQETPVAAVPPKATVPPDRCRPVMVTVVPPASGPVSGLTASTSGGDGDVEP